MTEGNPRSTVITGAAGGFGYETVRKLAQHHPESPIYAADIDPRIHAAFPEEDYPNVVPLEFDVRDPVHIAHAVERVMDETGRVDVLVNNAGVINAGRLHTYFQDGRPTQQLRDLYETNLAGPVLLMNEVLRHMRQQQSGLVVNITSASEHNRSPLRIPYTDYKAVFAGITQRAAQEEAPYNIRVVNVQPGMHNTGIDKNKWTEGTDEVEGIAVQRLYDWWRNQFGGNPEAVAETIHRITEGEITDQRVLVGLDTRITTFMHENVPGWDRMFTAGFDAVVFPIKMAVRLEQRANER